MTKWIWRLSDPAEHNSLRFKLLQAKYFNTDNIFAATSQGGSQFWRSINKIKHFFKLGAKYHVENGEKVCFWTDWWVGHAPLASRFPRLFDISSNKNISVAHALPDKGSIATTPNILPPPYVLKLGQFYFEVPPEDDVKPNFRTPPMEFHVRRGATAKDI
jgi:hypothetical protein